MTERFDLRVGANGRMVLPKAVRDAMGLTGESKVSLSIEGEVVQLVPIGHRVRRARELYRQVAAEPRTTDEFLAERRAEAAREDGEPSETAAGAA